MLVEITENRTGETLLLRRLAPYESIDPKALARAWLNRTYAGAVRMAPRTGHIPAGCADYRCEVRATKAESAVIWAAWDFYLETESA